MVLEVPPGEHSLSVVFGPTDLRLGALLATVVTVLAGQRGADPPPGAAPGVVGAGDGRAVGRAVAAGGGGGLAHGLADGRGAGGRCRFRRRAPRSGVWSAPGLQAGEGALLVNVAEAVATGRAWITSPGGASVGPTRHVDVQQLTVDDGDPDRGVAAVSRRQWLYLHPPSSVSVDVALPAGRTAWFQSSLAMEPRMWAAEVGDGVRYLVTVAPLDRQGRPGAPETVLDTTLNPRAQKDHRRWVPAEADLSRWAGRVVRVTLTTEHLADLAYDWAGWGQPVVTVRETDRERPLASQPVPAWARGE